MSSPNTPKYTFGRVFDAFSVYPASPRNVNPAPTPVYISTTSPAPTPANISTANPAPTHASHAIQTVNVITINESSMTVRKSRMIQGRRVTSEELEYEMFPCGTRIEKRSRKYKFTYLIGATREASINARIHAEQTAVQEYNEMVFALTSGDVRKRVQETSENQGVMVATQDAIILFREPIAILSEHDANIKRRKIATSQISNQLQNAVQTLDDETTKRSRKVNKHGRQENVDTSDDDLIEN